MKTRLEMPQYDWKTRTATMFAAFAAGSIPTVLSTLHTDPEKDTYLCAEEKISIPGVENPRLRLNYAKFHKLQPDGVSGRLYFNYNDLRAGFMHQIAEMNFDVISERHFRLVHRRVEGSMRGNTIGSQLLKTAEGWFAQLSKTQKTDITIDFKTGQLGVMQWAVKNGYSPTKDNAQLFEDIFQNPNRFNVRDVRDGLDATPKKRIYTKTEPQSPVKISFEKTLLHHS